MTAPEVLVAEVLVAEAREALLNGPVFRVRMAEAAPGGVEAVNAEGVEFPKGRGLYETPEGDAVVRASANGQPCRPVGGWEHRGDQLRLGVEEHLEPGHVFEEASRPPDPLSDTPGPQYALASIQARTSKTRRVVTSAGRAAAHR